MIKKTLHTLFVGLLVTAPMYAQTIETPANTALTISSDLTLPVNKALQIDGSTFLKMLPPATGNIVMGVGSGTALTTGQQNIFIGYEAGQKTNTTANLFIGYRAGKNNTTGQFNSFIGVQAGTNNTTGSSNYIFGTNAGFNNLSGSGNYFFGDQAGLNNTTGGFNVFLGANAGLTNVGGSNNTLIGFESNVGGANFTNATAIGFRAVVNQSNAVVLGGTGVNSVNVGIGNTAPTARLHITSGVANSSGLRLENLTSATTPGSSASKFLTVDASGNVILAAYSAGAREAVSGFDALWEKKGNLLQSVSGTGVVVGSGITKLPSGYSMYVGQGLLAERVKVAVKNSSDWSDYVFAPSYKLRSLGEVEAYVKANQHLPGVPSAEQVVKDGVDVVQMNAKLLEKIEELTLYMIDLKKENQQIKAENRQIKQMLQKRPAKK